MCSTNEHFIRCLGTGQHLKNRYGSGYLLELKLKSLASETSGFAEQTRVNTARTERMNLLTDFIVRLFSSAVILESFEDRIIFNIAQENVVSLAHTFESLEKGTSKFLHSSPSSPPPRKKCEYLNNYLYSLSIECVCITVREELNIEEYSFSQTTLEQVFIKFAHVQEDEDEDENSEEVSIKL